MLRASLWKPRRAILGALRGRQAVHLLADAICRSFRSGVRSLCLVHYHWQFAAYPASPITSQGFVECCVLAVLLQVGILTLRQVESALCLLWEQTAHNLLPVLIVLHPSVMGGV